MLVPVDSRHLRSVWDYVERGLWAVIKKLRDDWIPADVYTEIRCGVSRLFMLQYDGELKGFVVVQFWPQYHNGPRMFIRALWSEPGALVAHRADVYEDLDELARSNGATAMRQLSPRRWDADGWTLKQYVYEREVPTLQIEKRGGFVDPYVTTPNPYAEVKEA